MLWIKVASALEGLNTFMRPLNPSNAEVTFVQCSKKAENYENQLNPVMLVFIEKLLLSTQMSTHMPVLQSFLSFLSSCHADQISQQQHKG